MENDSTNVADVRLRPAAPKPVQVKHLNVPPKYEKRESIHARRQLPKVPEGKEREFHSLTPQLRLERPVSAGVAVRAATDELTVLRNTELPQPGQQRLASNVGEPSVAVNQDVVVYTGNWYAARSTD